MITRWSLLALLVVLTGAAMTIVAGEAYLQRWIDSGIKFDVGGRRRVVLPQGRSIVYYESRVATPAQTSMRLIDPYGDPVPLEDPARPASFRVGSPLIGYASYRPLCEIDLEESGEYELVCVNVSVRSADMVPADDRVVLRKRPPTPEQAMRVRQIVHIAGATTTFVPALVLYILHALALARRARAAETTR